MKELIIENMGAIVTILTIIITWFLGVLSKKSRFISNNIIPLQNLAIGLIVACIYWALTKDFNEAIALSGLMAGGTYDLVHNLNKFKKEKLEVDQEEIELLLERDDDENEII